MAMTKTRMIASACILISSLVIAACGGSGSGSGSLGSIPGSGASSNSSSGAPADTSPPVIVLNGDDSITISVGTGYIEQGARATDNVDGVLEVVITGSVDTDTVGSYTLTFTATDAADNSSTATRIVEVTDSTPPVITLIGESDTAIAQGESYIEQGARATDNVDGAVAVVITGSVDTDTAGSYTLTYTATDVANNSISASRRVDVIDPAFITTWKTDNPGSSDDNQIKIGTSGSGYDYQIDWGDGNIDTNVSADITHTYASPGTYTIKITGSFPQLVFLDGQEVYDNAKLLSVENWGTIKWESMSTAFYQCTNLVINTTYAPDLSQVTDMGHMFAGATSFNQDLSKWDVSSVTDMGSMFNGATRFNQDLSEWDVSSVTVMSNMFRRAENFNQDLSDWDVSSVTDMRSVFHLAIRFNQDLSDWNVSSATDMRSMFFGAARFNQNLSEWDVSSVRYMPFMFAGATRFDQDLGSWDVSSVTNMSHMFFRAESFNQNLGEWDVSSVTDMLHMFSGVSISTANYDALLFGWSNISLQSNIRFSAGGAKYSNTSQAERGVLTGIYNWEITDGGVAP